MSTESTLLRQLADAIERAERLDAWFSGAKDCPRDKIGVALGWDWMSGNPGHSDAVVAVRQKLTEQWHEMTRQVVAEAWVRVEMAREALARGEA